MSSKVSTFPKLEKNISADSINEISFFSTAIGEVSSKKQIADLMLKTVNKLIPTNLMLMISKEGSDFKILSQLGDEKFLSTTSRLALSPDVIKWVLEQNKPAFLNASGDEYFIFIPLIDFYDEKKIDHGIVVINGRRGNLDLIKELNLKLHVLSKLTSANLTKIVLSERLTLLNEIRGKIKSDLKLTTKLQKSVSEGHLNGIKCLVLEDEDSIFNGNIWWTSKAADDINLVFIAQIHCAGLPSALVGGYILGELNALKKNLFLCKKPAEVMKYLNTSLNFVFKNTGITINAWYGVFKMSTKTIYFSNANHPNPFLISLEQHVSRLADPLSQKGNPLGVNLNSIFTESELNISHTSKIVICTKGFLDMTSTIGKRYDPNWLPQVLETVGALPLSEMHSSLKSILSVNGTAKIAPRLALLLEFSS
jgi:hypothetical protein